MSIKKNVGRKNIRMKTHKLMLHCRNNDILFLRKDKYSKQACYTFKFHPEITLLLNKGNNKITELRTILQRESQNS